MSGAADESKPTGLGGFEETLKDFWVSRPRRPEHGRKIAGVAAAIGNRYGIDPVIVRVALASATLFGGIGLSLYLLGWLFFPGEHDEVSPAEALLGRGHSSMPKGLTVALGLAFFPISTWAFSQEWFRGGGMIGFALLLIALYLLHRSRGHEHRPVAPVKTTASPEFSASFSMATGATATETASGTPSGHATGWDPLGAPPLAWDLPDPQTAPTPPPPPRARAPRRRSKVGITTFGIALLVAGAGVALGSSHHPWFSGQHVIGLVLGVLGVGLVAGGLVGGGRGLIGLAVPLSIAGIVLTAVPVEDFTGGFGNLTEIPRTAAEVQPVYQHTAGDVEIDLTRLPADVPVSTIVRNGAGQTMIIVPRTADVRYTCEIQAGNADCLGTETDGVARPAITGFDTGTDGPGGLQLTLHVKQGGGNLEVRRG
ncbi:PspC domain-containing protein [Amycolatopsis cynarae]|uniref:PspC domain-containing protein n=1 Tax=Amycolatopsis cynarae TaxID=2995223 RepID=A0ABY7AZF5_9PSEU|nr:PspC domain-containing protein [Amycolatopsis sp. HUAS 11-8]WAL65075.1 PspC domain-containing protein [Amycolatopsis sp. HUAS 11-8]